IFVERADEGALRLGEHSVVSDIGDRPAAGDGGEAGAFAGHDAAADAVAVKQAAAAIGVQREDGVEILALQIAVRPGAFEGVEESIVVPDLLAGFDEGGDTL